MSAPIFSLDRVFKRHYYTYMKLLISCPGTSIRAIRLRRLVAVMAQDVHLQKRAERVLCLPQFKGWGSEDMRKKMMAVCREIQNEFSH